MRVGLTISLVAHSAGLVAVLLCFPLHRSSYPEVIPVSVATIGEAENPGFEVSTRPKLGVGHGSIILKSKPTLPSFQAKAEQTLLVAKSAEPPPEGNQPSVSQMPHPLASNQGDMPADQAAWAEPQDTSSKAASAQPLATPETYLWNTAEASPANGSVETVFAEKPSDQPAGLKITRHTDWDANPVEDNTLTYSAPGSSVKFTVREAYSSGFGEPALAPGIGMQVNENSAPFGLTQVQWGADGMARSQRLDWTVVNLKNFRVTAFGYQNEVGRDFQPFGQAKNEFAMAGISTMKAGGQVRVGPFGFGFAESTLENAGPVTNLAAVQQGATNLAAVQQEALVTLDLRHLLSGTQGSSGLFSKLLPTLWVTRSDKHTPTAGQEAVPRDAITSSFGAPTIWVTGEIVPREIVTSSFGSTWTWDDSYASLNYWSYSSDGNARLAASAGAGHGVNASFGVYYSSFGIDADLSYGQSENVAPSTQSASVVYDSSVTVSYKPDKLPGLWASAATGNYNQNAIAHGGSSSDLYGVTNGEYWSMTAGLDLTSLFWSPEASESGALTGQRSSAKLLYRYSESLDSFAGSTGNADSLVAMMIQRNF